MVIGHDPDAAICLPDEEVARRHASITHSGDGKLAIHDLGSMNRVLVNGRAVSEAQLKHGDTIELGRTKLLVQAMVQAEVDAPPSPAPGDDDLLPRHRFPVGLVMNGLLVAALVVAVMTWHRSARAPHTPQPVPNPLALDTYLAATTGVSTAAAATDATAPPPAVKTDETMSGVVTIAAVTSAPPPVMNVFTGVAFAPAAVATEKLDRIEQELALMRVTMQGLSNNRPVVAAAPVVTNAPVQIAPSVQPEPPPPAGAMVPRPKAPTVSGAFVLAELRQNKFPATDEFEEMRIVSASLQATPANAPVKALRVEVRFFDRLERDGAIVPSQAIVTPRTVQPSGAAGSGRYSVGATYVAPRRADGSAPRAAIYHGFVVRVYDGARLLAADAQPHNLLDESNAAPKSAP